MVLSYTMAFAYNVGRGYQVGLTMVCPVLLILCVQFPWLVFQLWNVEKNLSGPNPNVRFVEQDAWAIGLITRPTCKWDSIDSASSICSMRLRQASLCLAPPGRPWARRASQQGQF